MAIFRLWLLMAVVLPVLLADPRLDFSWWTTYVIKPLGFLFIINTCTLAVICILLSSLWWEEGVARKTS